jgi:hypothetical protein
MQQMSSDDVKDKQNAAAMQQQLDLPIPRAAREATQACDHPGWISRLRALHDAPSEPTGSAVELLRELRDQSP